MASFLRLKIAQSHLLADEIAYSEAHGHICLKFIRRMATQLGIDEGALSDSDIELGFLDADGNC